MTSFFSFFPLIIYMTSMWSDIRMWNIIKEHFVAFYHLPIYRNEQKKRWKTKPAIWGNSILDNYSNLIALSINIKEITFYTKKEKKEKIVTINTTYQQNGIDHRFFCRKFAQDSSFEKYSPNPRNSSMSKNSALNQKLRISIAQSSPHFEM